MADEDDFLALSVLATFFEHVVKLAQKRKEKNRILFLRLHISGLFGHPKSVYILTYTTKDINTYVVFCLF